MKLEDLVIGDVLVLKDKKGYMESILKFGGAYSYKKGEITGFTTEIGQIERIKIYLEAEDGYVFHIYERDLDYWEIKIKKCIWK